MPEGVEVKLQTEFLQKNFINSILKSFHIYSGRYIRHTKPIELIKFKESLPSKIIIIKNKGKFIYFILENKWIIMIRLGMTGYFHKNNRIKHDHFDFVTSKGNLFLNDYRNFGTISFTHDINILNKKLNEIGIDPLQEKLTKKIFNEKISEYCENHKNNILADFLIRQDYIAGIGNYLRSDILYISSLHPLKNICELNEEEKNRLLKAIKYVIYKSYNDQKYKGDYEFIIYGKKDAMKLKYKGRTIFYKQQTRKN